MHWLEAGSSLVLYNLKLCKGSRLHYFLGKRKKNILLTLSVKYAKWTKIK